MISDLRFRIADLGSAALALAMLALAASAFAQAPDRSKPPALGPAPSLKLPAIQKQKLSNGLAVWIVEHHEVPLAQINMPPQCLPGRAWRSRRSMRRARHESTLRHFAPGR